MGSKRNDLRPIVKEFRDGENPEKLRKKEMTFFAGPDLLKAGAKKLRMVFPHISVLLKPPQLPYGAKTIFGHGPPAVPEIFYGNPL